MNEEERLAVMAHAYGAEEDVYGETIGPSKVDELEGHVAALATEVSELKDSVDELTAALNRAIKVAIAHG